MLDLSNRRLMFNSLINFGGKILPLLVGIITIPIFISKIGVERFGILTIVWALIGYFGIFDLGVGLATTKFVAEYLALKKLEELPSLIWTSLSLLFTLGLIAGLLLYLSSPWFVDHFFKISPQLLRETTTSFYLLSFTIPFVFATACMTGILGAQQRFALINSIQVPASVANYLAPLPILLFSNSLPYVVAMTAFLRLLVCLVFFFLGLRSLPGLNRIRMPRLLYAKQLLGFGGWLTISGIISPVMVYMDRFLIGAWLSMEVVAYYVTPYELAGKLRIIPISLMPVIFPAFSAHAAENQDKLVALYHRAVKYIFLALAPVVVCIITLAHPFFHLWLGPKFAELSAPILQLLALGVLINSLAHVPHGAIQATGRPDLPAKLHLIELPIYLGVIWFSIQALGLIGVALAWVLRVSIDAGMLFWWGQRLIPQTFSARTEYKPALCLGIVILTGGTLFLGLVPSLAVKIVMLPAVLIFVAFWAWRYLLDDMEKAQVILAKNKLAELRCSF